MRKLLLLGAAALMVPSVAFADGEAPAAPVGWYFGAGAGWTDMELPEHANAAANVPDIGGGVYEAPSLQTDVDGVSYGGAVGYDWASGWRWGVGARFFDGDGSASQAISLLAGQSVRRGNIFGLTQIDGALAGPRDGDHTLDVDVNEFSVGTSIGRNLGGMFRADIVASYNDTSTTYVSEVDVTGGGFTDFGRTSTKFSTSTVELAARVSANIGLSEGISLGLGGSAGWGIRNIDMDASQRRLFNGGLASATALTEDRDVDAIIARLDASLNYAVSPGTMIGLTANYVYDDSVPGYVEPTYAAGIGNTGTAATFETDSQTTMTYGARLVGRF